jgi:hypothetical protein
VSKLDLWRRRWTRREIAIWLSALIVTLTLGVLAATDVVGAWVLVVQSVLVGIVGLLRYRAEIEEKKRGSGEANAADQDK